MSAELLEKCEALLLELNLLEQGQPFQATSLTGGVSSDIALVKLKTSQVCVKFARSQLKVEAEWFAPVHRSAAEYAWLEMASKVAPESAIKLFGYSSALNGFAMEYLNCAETYLWKAHLLAQKNTDGVAAKVGDLIGRIHAASIASDFQKDKFDNADDFHALRIEPYLLYTAKQHATVADKLNALAEDLYRSRQVLVHGDVSPKNIMVRPAGPVLLDAECATLGDASFDSAFCLNHLLIKAIHLPLTNLSLLRSVNDFWQAYKARINWEEPTGLEQRVCLLIPALMLARVDGKSPVEYLSQSDRGLIRDISLELLTRPSNHIDHLTQRILELTSGKKL